MPPVAPPSHRALLDEIAAEILVDLDAQLERRDDNTVLVRETPTSAALTSNVSPSQKSADGWLTRIVSIDQVDARL
jgi:hypothetical protein